VEICRNLGISEATFHRWKKKFGGLDLSEVQELRQLRQESRQLKSIFADLTFDKQS
jgi:putative transposase